ncbi:hypothetical protein WJX72_008600 [[Myrmecia] bisecta]|uniref:SAM domain-containing protein n=1 Tax=[Myrmecia] bisecta TaxID=41462 RepID=A0AAW1R7V8_9CHLO
MPKVALMFLTRGALPHQAMWVEWLAIMDGLIPTDLIHEGLCATDLAPCLTSWQQQLAERKGIGSEPGERQLLFSVYVHPSKDYKQPYIEHVFNQAVIRKRVVTQWGSHSLVDAARALIRTALQDPLNQVFVLLDETTIPLYPPTLVWQQLLEEGVSRINPCYNRKVRNNTMLRWSPEMDPPIPAWLWRKSSQWFTLTRRHAQLIDSDVELDALFEQHCVRGWDEALNRARGCYPDEHYFPTLLAYYGLEKETSCASNTVYVDWRGADSHPRSFQPEEVTAKRVRRIREGKRRKCNGEVVIRQSLAMFVATANMTSYSCKRSRPTYNSQLISKGACSLFARKFEAPTVSSVMDLFFDCEAGLDILPFADCAGTARRLPDGIDGSEEEIDFDNGNPIDAAMFALRNGVLRKRVDSKFMDIVLDDSNRQQFKSRQPADDVETFLDSLELESVGKVFRENAVTGADLLEFSDEDFTSLLGLSPLQIRKIRRGLASNPTLGGPKGTSSAQAPSQADMTALNNQMAAAAMQTTRSPTAAQPQDQAQQAQQQAAAAGQAAAKQAEMAALNSQMAGANAAHNALISAEAELRQASGLLGKAAEALERAKGLTGAEMVGNLTRPAGLMGRRAFGGKPVTERMANVGEMALVKQAGEATQAAVAHTQRAYSLGVAGLPSIDLARVRSLSVVSVWAFDGMMGDFATRRKIQGNLDQVLDMQRDVRRAHEWAAAQVARVREDMARMGGMQAATAADMGSTGPAQVPSGQYAPAPAGYPAPAG